jgi:hypothetical protein
MQKDKLHKDQLNNIIKMKTLQFLEEKTWADFYIIYPWGSGQNISITQNPESIKGCQILLHNLKKLHDPNTIRRPKENCSLNKITCTLLLEKKEGNLPSTRGAPRNKNHKSSRSMSARHEQIVFFNSCKWLLK